MVKITFEIDLSVQEQARIFKAMELINSKKLNRFAKEAILKRPILIMEEYK